MLLRRTRTLLCGLLSLLWMPAAGAAAAQMLNDPPPPPPTSDAESSQRRPVVRHANTPGREPGDHAGEFPEFHFTIRPSDETGMSIVERPGAMTIEGGTWRDIFANVFGVKPNHIVCDLPLDMQRFNLAAAAPDDQPDLVLPIARRGVETALNVSARYETRDAMSCTLKALDAAKDKLKTADGAGAPALTLDETRLTGRAATMAELCEWLSKKLDADINDRTRLDGRFDFTIDLGDGKASTIAAALKSELGLDLQMKKKVVEWLLVTSPPPPSLPQPEKMLDPDGEPMDPAKWPRDWRVLTFWMSQWEPNVRALDTMNPIVKSLADQPIAFAYVTPHTEAELKPMFAEKKFASPVIVDTDGKLREALSVTALPRALIFDKRGYVVADTDPSLLTSGMLFKLVNGQAVEIPQRAGLLPVLRLADDWPIMPARPVIQVMIKPVLDHVAVVRREYVDTQRDLWEGEHVPFKQAVATAWGVSPARLSVRGAWPVYPLWIKIMAPEDRPNLRQELLRDALLQTYHPEVRRDVKESEVLVLTAPDAAKHKLGGPKPPKKLDINQLDGKPDPGVPRNVLTADSGTLMDLATQLEGFLGKPVVNETKLDGSFSWKLTLDGESPEAVRAAVESQLGLSLQPGKREIGIVIVDVPERQRKKK